MPRRAPRSIRDEVMRLAEPGPGEGGPVGDLAVEREARFDAWTTALDALAPWPSAWLVEDIHWAGGDLLAFLDRGRPRPTRHGRLVVATARPSLLESAPEWCAAGARIDLAALPVTDAGALIHACGR